MTIHPKNPPMGFTLLEVLIALVIVSIVFLSTLYSITEMTANTTLLREKTWCSLIASNVITETHLGIIDAPQYPNKISQQTRMADQVWSWTAEETPSWNPKLQGILVNVQNASGKPIYSLQGYIIKVKK